MVMSKKRLSLIAVMVLVLTVSMLATAFLSLAAADENGLSQNKDLGSNTGFRTEGVSLYDNFTMTFSIGPHPKSMAIGNLNSDSLPDLAIIYENNDNVYIFYQQEHGSFSDLHSQIVQANGNLTDIAIGDMDKDGMDDIVVCSPSTITPSIGRFEIFSQRLNYNLNGTYATYRTPNALALGDFDNDSSMDVAVLSSYSSTTYLTIHQSYYGFGQENHKVTNMQDGTLLCVGNFDNYAGIDVAVGDSQQGLVTIWRNNNTDLSSYDSEKWSEIGLNVSQPSSISFQQITDLGNPALVVADRDTSKVRMWQWNSALASLVEIKQVTGQTGIVDVVGIDLDHNLRRDIATVSNTSNNISYLYTPVGAYKGINGTFPSQYGPLQLIANDMNGDGNEDLIVLGSAGSTSGAVTIIYAIDEKLSNANDNFQGTDGMDSLLLGNFTTNGISISYLNRSANELRFLQSGKWWTVPVANGSRWAYSGSLYDERYQDVLVVDPVLDRIYIFRHSTSILTSSTPTTWLETGSSNPGPVYLADMDGSGTQDILVGTDDGFTIYLNSGTGQGYSSASNWTFNLPGAKTSWIMAGNFNKGLEAGQPMLDVAIMNSSSNRLEIYPQKESGSNFEPSDNMSILIPSTVEWADAGDVNADGYCDILVGTEDGRLIVYYQNEGVGFSDSNKISFTGPFGFGSADLGDLDDDGQLEIVMVGDEIGVVNMLELVGGSFQIISTQTVGAGPFIALAGDSNGDLRSDMIISSSGSKMISTFAQNDLFPQANWSHLPSSPKEGASVSFNASASSDSLSDLSNLSYQWSVRYNGSSAWTVLANGSVATMDYTFTSNGTHAISLKVTDRGGLSSYLNQSVIVGDDSPVASFQIITNDAVEGGAVHFKDTSTSPADDILHFIWDYGDGRTDNFSSKTDPVHIYAQNGTYTVKLTVVDEDGSQDEHTSMVSVADEVPIASFTASESPYQENETIAFNSTSSSPVDLIMTQEWRVDGILSGTGSSFTHQFLANGTFLINLTVVDSDGSRSYSETSIIVLDLGPTVNFEFARPSNNEGVSIIFQDLSTSYDPIVKRNWDMGDGTHLSGVSVSHAYVQQGDYQVTLHVEDSDGTIVTKSVLLTVLDTTPQVGNISTNGLGGTSFAKRTNVTFTLDVIPAYDPLTYYWAIKTSAGLLYSLTTNVPSMYYRFDQGGSYEIDVMVNDTDGSIERNIYITIIDSSPIPIFTFDVITLEGQVFFSANQTYDPDGDTPNLLYRWAFGDGSSWTDWSSSNRTITHQYTVEGIFSVIMQVTDSNNSAVQNSTNVIIDRTPPAITFLDRPTKADVGQAIEIRVSIADATPLKDVSLLYTLDQVSWVVVPMVLTGPGNYTGQIPSQDADREIFYSVRAVDSNNYNQTTVPAQLLVEKDMTMTYLLLSLLAIIGVMSVIIIYLWRTRPVVDEAFLIYQDGNLIAHQARRLKPGMDDQILSSMLVAIQGFVSDSFKDESITGLKRMDFGDKKLMIEKREFYYLAVVLMGSRTGNVQSRLEKVMDSIDEKYGIELIAWDGDLDRVRGIKDETKPLFERVGFFEKRLNDKK